MDRLPNIQMQSPEEVSQLADDLRIINDDLPIKEDLKGDPFVRENVISNRKVAPIKPKKTVSEKKLNSLAKAREIQKQKRAEKKRLELEKIKKTESQQSFEKDSQQEEIKGSELQLEVKDEQVIATKMETFKEQANKTIEKKEQKIETFIEQTGFDKDEDSQNMNEKEFEKWLKNFDRFKKMHDAVEKEKERQRLKEEQKEKQLRDKYFKMFKEQSFLENKINEKTPIESVQKTPKQFHDNSILHSEKPDYGEFSNYF